MQAPLTIEKAAAIDRAAEPKRCQAVLIDSLLAQVFGNYSTLV